MIRNNNFVSDGYTIMQAELEPKSWKRRESGEQVPDLQKFIDTLKRNDKFIILGHLVQRSLRPSLSDKPLAIFHGLEKEIVIQQKYFNMFKGRKCTFAIAESTYSHVPVIVFEGNEIIGAIMPIKN